MKGNLSEMTLKEVLAGGDVELAVLPWGSCECHNLHLPFGCDTLVIRAIAEQAGKKAKEEGANVVVLPTIPVGTNSNMFAFPMVLHMSPSTQLAVMKDIVDSVEHHGVRKLVVMNGHGGNEFKAILRELYGKTSVQLFLLEPVGMIQDVIEDVCDDASGEHANESETSLFMYLYPDLAHLEWADDGAIAKPALSGLEKGWLWIVRPWHLLTKNSGYGNPVKATAEKGKAIMEAAVERVASVLVELSKVRIDEKFPYS